MTDAHETRGNEATMLWSDQRISAKAQEIIVLGHTPLGAIRRVAYEVRDEYEQALAALTAEHAKLQEHRAIIVRVLEDEIDRHIMSGGLAANRKELNAALRWLLAQKEGDDE